MPGLKPCRAFPVHGNKTTHTALKSALYRAFPLRQWKERIIAKPDARFNMTRTGILDLNRLVYHQQGIRLRRSAGDDDDDGDDGRDDVCRPKAYWPQAY